MTTQTSTIIDLKLTFLRAQISALSRPVTLPTNFHSRQPAHLDEKEILRHRQIDEALAQFNQHIRKHSRLVYSQAAQRHVAEQIDKLYWRAGEGIINDGNSGDGGLDRGLDLADSSVIATLPEQWEDEAEDDEVTGQYAELVGRLQTLDGRRQQLRKKVETYKALKSAIEPFDDPRDNVQQNLITRGGELERELETMRTLLARVAGRMAGLEASNEERPEDVIQIVDEQKVRATLGF